MIKIFVCLDCGRIFEEPAHWEERHGLDSPPYEKWSGCIYCGGAYTEAHCCDRCGEWITTDTYVQVGNERYCEDCFIIKNLDDD